MADDRQRLHPGWWAAGGAGGAALAAAALWALAPARPPADKAAMAAAVREAILANPEIIPQAIDRLHDRQAATLVAANRAAIETPFAGAWAGAADGDVVLVEFFDYQCPYCRQSAADVDRLLAEDPKLKVVFRDFPVLGPDSERFARASLAAAQAGRYRPFYQAAFAARAPQGEARLTAAMAAAGTGDPGLSPAIGDELQRNLALGQALGLTGTPSYIVGGQILSGAVGHEALKAAIARAREARRAAPAA